MLNYFSKSILLLIFLVITICGIYPLALWVVGQTLFSFQANGSLLLNTNDKPIGSKLIAQPFTKDEYFQPRPSAASYDASASASSALAVSNYALRNRIANTLGPIVKYQNGQVVGPDIEKWYQQDSFQGKPHILAQWATLHQALAEVWVSSDATHRSFVDHWAKSHPAIVMQYIKDHPDDTAPKATDLAVVFFQYFSQENPGKFPVSASHTDIQSIFFDMWREDHADISLQNVPGDLVTTSASGLDPHITLQNALYQLDRVANAWAVKLKRNPDQMKNEIQLILEANAEAPFNGLAGEKFINVLVVNLKLHEKYEVQ